MLAETDRQLRECREAETHVHSLPGGYEGTAAQIARRTDQDRTDYEWFPYLPDDQHRCPLHPEELAFLAETHEWLTREVRDELQREVGTFDLPGVVDFAAAVQRLHAAEREALDAQSLARQEQLAALQRVADADLESLRTFLSQLEEQATQADHTLGELTCEILKDFLVDRTARWERLEQETDDLLGQIQRNLQRAGTMAFDIPPDAASAKLASDIRRRLAHLKSGGWRGWRFLAPRVMRETLYIEKRCRVDGEAPREEQSLETLLAYAELRECLANFDRLWPAEIHHDPDDARRAARDVADLIEQFCQLVKFVKSCDRSALSVLSVERQKLAERSERDAWRHAIEAVLARRRVETARSSLDALNKQLRGIVSENRHPCLQDLIEALDQHDTERWGSAWEKREILRKHKDRYARYQALVGRIDSACPELARLIQSHEGRPEWGERLRNLQRAWDWAAARAWIRRQTDRRSYATLSEDWRRLQQRIETKLQELVALRAWAAFFDRMDDETEQNLTAWTKAVARIGKGTGKHAYRHRRTARSYLMKCIPKMPAWVMPYHKLWDTVGPTPGLFDTVIVDEASQAGIEALLLLLLAKRIVVVGDDKQNSPEAVGVLEDDIARLASNHLRSFTFRDEFRPDTSLYDHAERAFGNVISLREHFRCVPEIIRFSNELCYTDAPLIPLRQPPPNRLPPLVAEFVRQGSCEGEGQRILNRAESEAVVNAIRACIADEAYKGKTMGVVVLQGHAQAEYIERRLAAVLEPSVLDERRLRCGTPATFQGDQRDVMFVSLVVAPNHHFRALTGLPDQRRFNVAMSRARDQVWVFHSVSLTDLSREDLRWQLLHFVTNPHQAALEVLTAELDRLERTAKQRSREPGYQPEPYESWFEVDMALELLRRNYRIRPQVQVAGYRIDLVVEGADKRLAVECDGEAWHGPERFDQDMHRQRQLQRAGWTFVRIPESEFYVDRARAVRRIVDACEELGIRPIGQEEPKIEQQVPISVSPTDPLYCDEEEDDDANGEAEEAEEPDEEEGRDQGSISDEPYNRRLEYPDPRTASTDEVQEALRRLIQEEGPLNKRLLFRLYVEGCPNLRRTGKMIRSLLNHTLYRMQKTGQILVEDELGDHTLESQVMRLAGTPKVTRRPAGTRDLTEIPPSELFSVFEHLLPSSFPDEEDEEACFRDLLDHYGFVRLTQARRRYLMRILDHYRRQRFR